MKDLGELLAGMGLSRLSSTPKGYKACCAINPEHHDNSPSMHIHAEKGLVKCFSCGAFRPLFDFLIDNGVSFDEAIEYFLTDYGDTHKEVVKLRGMQEYVLGRKFPKSLLKRGFKRHTLKHFKVGYDEVEKHTTIPLMYNKILYGIQYRKYPKKFWISDGFPKDKYIYNYAPTEVRIYVEGQSDTWRVWQHGVKNVSATLNSYPSEGQLELMNQHKEIWMAYDNDYAGLRGVFLVQKEIGRTTEVKVLKYPAKDPGDCSKEVWNKALEHPMTFLEFEVELIRINPELHEQLVKAVHLKHGI